MRAVGDGTVEPDGAGEYESQGVEREGRRTFKTNVGKGNSPVLGSLALEKRRKRTGVCLNSQQKT